MNKYASTAALCWLKVNKMDDLKGKIENCLIATAIVGFVIAMLLGVVLELKHSIRMKIYAASHDCSWQYYGDVAGNDNGYICK